MLIIVVVAACVFVLLVILILWARVRRARGATGLAHRAYCVVSRVFVHLGVQVRLQKAYHRQHHSRTANRFHGL